MKTIKVYSASELKEKFPEGFEHAHNKWVESVSNDGIFWQDEIMTSFKAIFKESGITIKNYEISTDSTSYVEFDMETEVRNLEGNRALAWLENNLFYRLRENRTFKNRVKYYDNKPYNFTHYGKMKSCPFTGYCADEDFLESLLKDVKDGCTLSDAYHNLADKAADLFQAEYDDQCSENYFIDHADANGYQYTKDGRRI